MPRKKADDGKIILKTGELDRLLLGQTKVELEKTKYESKIRDITILELQAKLLQAKIAEEKTALTTLKTRHDRCKIELTENYNLITKKYNLADNKWGLNDETGEVVLES